MAGKCFFLEFFLEFWSFMREFQRKVDQKYIYEFRLYVFVSIFLGEWPSGLLHCNQKQKVSVSNPTRCLAGVREPTKLPVTSGQNCTNVVINFGLVRLLHREWQKSLEIEFPNSFQVFTFAYGLQKIARKMPLILFASCIYSLKFFFF